MSQGLGSSGRATLAAKRIQRTVGSARSTTPQIAQRSDTFEFIEGGSAAQRKKISKYFHVLLRKLADGNNQSYLSSLFEMSWGR